MLTPWTTELAQSGAGAFSRIWSGGSSIWAAGGGIPGIYKSDGGGTWALSLVAGSYVFGGGYAANDNSVFVAQHGTDYPYLYTTDGGANWYPADPIIIDAVTISRGYAIGGTGASCLWLLGKDIYGNHYIVKTTDNGYSWSIDYGLGVAEWNTIQVVSDTDIWVGCTNQILHWSGFAWGSVYVDLSYYTPVCVWEVAPGNTFIGYASADFVHVGGVFQWDGATLTPCTLPGQTTATRIGAISGNGTHLWAVDTNNAGVIYHSIDSGASWVWDGPVYYPQTNADFYDVCETATKVYTVSGYSADGASILGASLPAATEIVEDDTVTAADGVTRTSTRSVAHADTATAADGIQRVSARSITHADTATAADAIQRVSAHGVAHADTATAADVIQCVSAHNITHADTATVVDAAYTQRTMTYNVTHNDTLDAVDAMSVHTVVPGVFYADDSATTSDVVSVQLVRAGDITHADTATVIDHAVAHVTAAHAFYKDDTTSAVDVSARVHTGTFNFADTASTEDAATGSSPPSIKLVAPLDGSTDALRDAPILIYLQDGIGAAFDVASIVVVIDGITVFEALHPERGWSGRLTDIGPATRLLMLYSPDGFEYNAIVTVDVSANY